MNADPSPAARQVAIAMKSLWTSFQLLSVVALCVIYVYKYYFKYVLSKVAWKIWNQVKIQDLCELNYTCEEIKIKDVIFCYFCLIYSLLYYHAQYYLPNCLVLPVAGCIIMCSLLRQKPGHVKSYRLSLSTAERSGKSNLHFNTGNSVSVSLVLELSED